MSIFRGVNDRDGAEVAGVAEVAAVIHTFQQFLKKTEEADLEAFTTPTSCGLPKFEPFPQCCIST